MAKRRQRGRAVNGIVLLDKPRGLSSNQALQKVKHVFQARKAGHTGSLDPLATGLLPVCLGEATKISGFLLNADKRYLFHVKLGVSTTTGDAEGEITSRSDVPPLSDDEVRETLGQFSGPIEQIPPMHSALKQNGQPLYKLAHQGIEVEREPRKVVIHELKLLANRGDILELEVFCSKGTYVRTLAEDIGRMLGCGAHVDTLRRLQAGAFHIEEALTLEHLEAVPRADFGALDALLVPVERAVEDWPDVQVSQELAFYLARGQAVRVPEAPKAGLVRLFSPENRFFGVGCVLDDGRVSPKRLMRV
jgi:tRNA pseudouridine55 synthase